ncbi:hypothetical protein [Nonomuraea guangzhouensis]|uniref:Uncharacterized protein n=1 Tax=Nonomuraea guangzhouensis TaxID=1291555 RepID=A0ABW4GVR8_9ACTN|nr:hypothetical protein [Nonomuraea guangzhouensis]
MVDTDEKTIAEELREAAARSREHLLPHVVAEVLPQTAIVVLCGSIHDESAVTCRNCVLFDVKDRVLARLVAALLNAREPLASWLEQAAKDYEEEVYQEEGACHRGVCEPGCPGHEQVAVCDRCGNLLAPASPRQGPPCPCWTAPLAVARIVNGSAPQEANRG